MIRRHQFLILTILISSGSYAQGPDADSVFTVVLNALTTDEHVFHGNPDSLLRKGSWEALAYWDTETPKEIESLQEAVGDRYSFGKTEFRIDLIDPNNPRQIGLSVTGYFERKGNKLELYKEVNGPRRELEIWYLDENYIVIESEELRIFLTHEQSYYLLD